MVWEGRPFCGRRATVRAVSTETAARRWPLRLTQARIGDMLHDGNGTQVAIANAFTTVNPRTGATVRAVYYQVVGAVPDQFRVYSDDERDIASWRRVGDPGVAVTPVQRSQQGWGRAADANGLREAGLGHQRVDGRAGQRSRRGHVAQGQESGHGGSGGRAARGGVSVRRHLMRSLMRWTVAISSRTTWSRA